MRSQELQAHPQSQCQDATHVVQDVSPALHGDTLEYRQDGKQDIVKVGDAKVGPWPVLPTFSVALTQPGGGLFATGEVTHWIWICEEKNDAQTLSPETPKFSNPCWDSWAAETSSQGGGAMGRNQAPVEILPQLPTIPLCTGSLPMPTICLPLSSDQPSQELLVNLSLSTRTCPSLFKHAQDLLT